MATGEKESKKRKKEEAEMAASKTPKDSTEKKDKKEKKEKSAKKPTKGGEQTATSMVVDAPVKESAAEDYDDQIKRISIIANPLASRSLSKKCLKVVKKAAKAKQLRRGVKEVVKALRKGEKGLVMIAGDISPIDVIAHVPIMCEDAGLAYVYVPSKEQLGTAGATKRPTSCVMVKRHDDFAETYDELYTEVKALPLPI